MRVDRDDVDQSPDGSHRELGTSSFNSPAFTMPRCAYFIRRRTWENLTTTGGAAASSTVRPDSWSLAQQVGRGGDGNRGIRRAFMRGTPIARPVRHT